MFASANLRRLLSLLVTASISASCAGPGAVGPDGQPQTALERSVGTCVVTVGAGLLVDMLTNKRRVGAGTAVGAGLCAVVLAMNNEEDKKRLRESQLAALNSGRDRTDEYVGQDGQDRIIKTSVQTADIPPDLSSHQAPNGDHFVGPCRKTQTEISVQGQGSASLDPEVVCRTAQGNWLPWSGAATA
ncbi:MAG TPA: hypothetical protein VK779_11620 [Rhizomicrobium sp.]|nr:hypothetical protein [Rhizomicrobium sp.]